MTAADAAEFGAAQAQFRDMVARFLAEHSPASRVRQQIDAASGHDRAVWSAMAEQLGITGLHVPEALGGAGFGPVELAIVLEELGRQLYAGPFFSSTVMAGCALHQADAAAQARWFPDLAAGACVAALVLDDLQDPKALGQRITATADDRRLHGQAPLVLGAECATQLFVVARAGADTALYAVAPAHVTLRPRQSLDPTRPLTEVTFRDAPAERIGTWSPETVQRLWDTLAILLACELVGLAEALLQGTVAYMGMRVQFGRTIDSFQALKHRCADLLVDVELAKALARDGARILATPASPTASAHMAKAMAGDTAMSAARAAIQLRGGIGFTWEDDTHFYFKRAKSAEVLFGTPTQHRDRLVLHLAANEEAPARAR
jgi:alkylation response protein AidB-like acyl-CoA dehydrogenase